MLGLYIDNRHMFILSVFQPYSLFLIYIYITLLLFFQSTMELAKTHASDPNALKIIFSSIVLECKIFYSLNFQVNHLHWSHLITWILYSIILSLYYYENYFISLTEANYENVVPPWTWLGLNPFSKQSLHY